LLAVVLFAATVIALTLVASPPGGHPGQAAQPHHNPKMGTAFVHTVIDDHSRVAYAEIHDDETAAPATTVLRNAVPRFAARGVATERASSPTTAAPTSPTPGDTLGHERPGSRMRTFAG